MKSLFAILILAILTGCSKSDNANNKISYSVDYNSSSIISDKPIVVYSYPNPFRNIIVIGVSVLEKSKISISFSNKKGYLQKVVDGYEVETGQSTFQFAFENPASGAYLCEVVVNDVVERIEFINM
jgi:hypothetical protein